MVIFQRIHSTCGLAGVGVEFTKCHAETNGKTMILVTVECPSGLADTPTKEHETKCRGKSTGKRLNQLLLQCHYYRNCGLDCVLVLLRFFLK